MQGCCFQRYVFEHFNEARPRLTSSGGLYGSEAILQTSFGTIGVGVIERSRQLTIDGELFGGGNRAEELSSQYGILFATIRDDNGRTALDSPRAERTFRFVTDMEVGDLAGEVGE